MHASSTSRVPGSATRPLHLGVDDPRWLAFVASRADATPFHHPSWSRLIGECYDQRPFALALEQEDGTLVAGLPLLEARGLRRRRWLSLPFTDVCAPLAGSGLGSDLVDALDEARLAAGIARVEIRAAVESPLAHAASRGFLHTLPLESDPGPVFARFKRSQVQQVVRKAEREGYVKVRRCDHEDELVKTFYDLHLQTRRRLGVPVQPRRFFRLLWKRLLEPGLGFLLLAEAAGAPVAGGVFLTWNGHLTYKFGASDAAHLRLRPNNVLLWDAIKWGCTHGFRTFDFGRTERANHGLRAFKQGWGTIESGLVYSSLGTQPRASSGRLETALASVIRHSPAWVCRLVGETLYKHAA